MKVLVTRKIPEKGIDMLEEYFDVEVNPHSRAMSREELLEAVKDKDALLSLLNDKIDSEIMDAAPNLKIVANYAVGFDNIDLKAATKRGIIVTNTPDVLTETTADLTMALLLAVARRIVEADKFMRAGNFRGWEPMLFLGPDVHNKTIGIIGFGRIGKAVAKRACLGFNMRVLFYDVNGKSREKEINCDVSYAPLETLLKESDFICIHVPLTPETHHMIGEKELNMMKKTAVLINCARGPVVDENALVKALKEKKIFGAGLDVFENEPEMTPGLAELDNVVVLPHIGSASIEARTAMAELAAKNIIAVLNGKKPLTPVNSV